MLDQLSAGALESFAAVLTGYDFAKAAASPEAYSGPLHAWMIDTIAAEQARRRGEARELPLLQGLSAAEMLRAATFAAALVLTFRNVSAVTPATVAPATREKFQALASELEPVMLEVSEALTAMASQTEWQRVQH